jgi:hypothetical protein
MAPVLEADDVTAEWLASRLVAVGLAPAGSRVTSFDAAHIGAGKVGDNVRFTLSWSPEHAGPATVVGKFPSDDPASRMAGVALGNYDREVRFYRELAPTLAVRAPACYAAELDEATGRFSLLLEDLAPAEVGDQLTGCTLDEAAAAVAALVGLHAPRWADATLAAHEAWLVPKVVGGGELLAQVVGGLVPSFVDRYADALPDAVLTTVERMGEALPRWVVLPDGPLTVTHNDYRLDNLLFRSDGPATTVAVVDWQTVGLGPGIADVSYFLGAGLLPHDRRDHEEQLVRDYRGALAATGIDVPWDALWREYRRSAPAGLVMAILASSVVGADDRSDAMFCAMAERHAVQLTDLDALSLL